MFALTADELFSLSECYNAILVSGVWRSGLARMVWDHEVGGSNPLTPIIDRK
jgi:hypothetical protein